MAKYCILHTAEAELIRPVLFNDCVLHSAYLSVAITLQTNKPHASVFKEKLPSMLQIKVSEDNSFFILYHQLPVMLVKD